LGYNWVDPPDRIVKWVELGLIRCTLVDPITYINIDYVYFSTCKLKIFASSVVIDLITPPIAI